MSQSGNGRGGGLAYDEFVALAKKHGFAAVEFGIEWLEQKIASEGEEAARQWLAEQGIQHAAFWLPVACAMRKASIGREFASLASESKSGSSRWLHFLA